MNKVIKPPEVLKIIRQGGKILGRIRDEIACQAKPCVTSEELELLAEKLIQEAGGRPSFKGFCSTKNETPFPTCLCVSINEEVVHGPARPARVLKSGDLVGLDIGMQWPAENGYFTDTAVTVGVGKITAEAEKLLQVTKEALAVGVRSVKPGGRISDIGQAIEKFVAPYGFGIVRDLVGHGVGYAVHEAPAIPNFFNPALKKVKIKNGMVLALEPMITAGTARIKVLSDGWTIITADKSLAAHFEHTIIITDRGAEVVT